MKQTSKKWLGTLLSLCLIGALLLGTLPMSLVGATNSTNLIVGGDFESFTVGDKLSEVTTIDANNKNTWLGRTNSAEDHVIESQTNGNKYLSFYNEVYFGLEGKLKAGSRYVLTLKLKSTGTTNSTAFYMRLVPGDNPTTYTKGEYIDASKEDGTATWISGSGTMKKLTEAWTTFTYYYNPTTDDIATGKDVLRLYCKNQRVHIDDVTLTEIVTVTANGGMVNDGKFDSQQSTLAKFDDTKNPSTDKMNWFTEQADQGVVKTEGTNKYLELTGRAAVGLNEPLVQDRLYQISFKLRAVASESARTTRLDPVMAKGSAFSTYASTTTTSNKTDMSGGKWVGSADFKTVTADAWKEFNFYYLHTAENVKKGIDSLSFIIGAGGVGGSVQIDDVKVEYLYIDPFDGKMVTDGGFNNQTTTLGAASTTDYPKTNSSDWYTKTANKGVIKAEDDGNKYLTLSADRVAVGLNQAMEKDKIYLISFKIKAVSTGTKATRLDPRMLKGSAPTSSWSSGDYTVTTQPTYSNGALSGNGWLGSSVMNALSTTAWSEYYFFYKHTEENISKGIDSLMFIVSGGDILLDAVSVQEYVPDTFDGVMVNDGGINNQGTIAARSASGKNPSNDDDNWYVKTAGKATVKADSSLNNYLEFTDRVFVGLNQALVKDQYYKISFKLKAVDATTALKALYIRMYNGANDNYANTYNVATGYASNDNVIGATEMKQRVTNTGWTEFTFYYQHGDEGVNEALDSLGFIYGDTTNPILLDEVLVKPYNVQTFDGGLIKDGGVNSQKPVLSKANASANSETDDTNWYVATENAAQVKTEANDNNYLEFTDRVFLPIDGDLKVDQLYKITFKLKAPVGGSESLQALYIRIYDGAGRVNAVNASNSYDMKGGAFIGSNAMRTCVTDQKWEEVTYYYLHTAENDAKSVDSLAFVYNTKVTTVLLDAVTMTEFTAPDFGDAYITDSEFDYQNATLDMATALNSPANDRAHWYSSGENLAVVKTEKDGNNYLEMTGNAYIGLNQPLEPNAMYKLTFRVKKANANMFNEPFRPRLYDAGLSKNAGLVDRIDLTGDQYIGSYDLRSNLSEEEWLEYTYYYQHNPDNVAKNLTVLRFDVWEYNTPDAPEVICLDSVVFTKMNYGVVGDKATASYTGALFNEMNLQKLIDKKSDLSASKVYKINAKPFNMYTIGITAGSSKVSNSKIYLSFDGTNVMSLSEADAPEPVIKADGTKSRRYSYEVLTDETGVIYLIVENDDKALQIEDITVFQSLSRSTQLPIGVANDPNVSLYAADTLKELRVVGAEDADTATDASPETGEAPVLPVLLIVFALALSTAVLVMLKKGGAQA